MTRAIRCAMAFAVLLLAALPGAASAASVASQQDAGHTGFASGGSLDAPPLTQRWSRNLGNTVGHPLVAGGKVYVVAIGSTGGYKLYVLDAQTGDTSWWRPMGSGDIAYDGGRVVISDSGLLTAVDAGDGSTKWAKQLSGDSYYTRSVIAGDGMVFVSGLTLTAYDLSDGTLRWTNAASSDSTMPALDARNVYTGPSSCGGQAYNRQTGARAWPPYLGYCSSYGSAFVANGAWTSLSNRLQDAANGVVRDNVMGGQPAFAGATEVVLNNGELQARNAATGVGMWATTGDGYLSTLPLVVNHTVYVGSRNGKLFAFDLATGAQTWSATVGDPTGYSGYSDNAPGYAGMGSGDGLLVVNRSGTVYALQSAAARPGLNVAITSGPSGPVDRNSATFSYSGAGALTSCRLDGGAWAACATSSSYGPLAEGPHVFEVRSQDLNGTPVGLAARGFSVDTVAPHTTLSNGPLALTNATTATVKVTSDGATIQCSLDGAGWVDCPPPNYYDTTISFAGLPDGEHVLRVRGVDGVGNVEASPAELRWTVDTVAPGVAFDSWPSDGGSTDATIHFHASEPGVVFACAMDYYSVYTTYSACSSPYTAEGLGRGSHTFFVSARDTAGNVTVAQTSWYVQDPATYTPPTSSSSEPSPASSQTSPPTYSTTYYPTTTSAPSTGTSSRAARLRSVSSVTGDVAKVLAGSLGGAPALNILAAPVPVFVIGPDQAGKITVELLERSGKKRVLAKGTGATRPSSSTLVSMRVNKTGKKVLAKSRKLKVTVRVTFRSTTGAVTTTTRRARLG